MLQYNEVKEGRYIVLDDAPYEVLNSHVFRKQQRKPVNAAKLKNLMTGKVTEYSFAVSDKVEEAEIDEKKMVFLYHPPRLPAGRQGEYWFAEIANPSQRLKLNADQVQGKEKFLKPKQPVGLLYFRDQLIGLKLPIKLSLKVVTAAPAVKGNTVQGGAKKVILETGLELNVPLFVNEGDELTVNTQTGEYVERANKDY